MLSPGPIILLGSGETGPTSGKILEELAARFLPPLRVRILETPAGFELNSAQVAGRVADFFTSRLQNYKPQVSLVPARKRGTPYSPENPEIVADLLLAQMIFLGPGSPSYAVRQLQGSLCWYALNALHRSGSAVIFSSAATVAISHLALPVYEIYKVGEDPHWKNGLDFLAPYGLSLVILPHWNNSDGGTELDTRCCYIGQERFSSLYARLPAACTCLGIDEHTALWLDLPQSSARVIGAGQVHVLRQGTETHFVAGNDFPLSVLGPFHMPADPSIEIPPDRWSWLQERIMKARSFTPPIPPEVLALNQQRQEAREQKEWSMADHLRRQIEALGWSILDTPQGPLLKPR